MRYREIKSYGYLRGQTETMTAHASSSEAEKPCKPVKQAYAYSRAAARAEELRTAV
jgi:hypothetical protein